MQRFEGALTVQVQVDAEVDAALKVGQTTTRVEVQEVTPLVQTDSPTLGQFLERQRIEQLPVNGRGYQNLLVTVPGVTWSNQGFGIGALVRGYGLPSGSTTLTFDGAAQNEVWEGWDVARTPDLDTIQEMQIETNNSSAKFTRPTTIVMSSKSGTNQVHGALFYTNRNSGYGVARQRQDNFTKPPYLNRNEFGGSVGGPVYIPKVYNGHNQTFFFFSWEDIRSLSSTTQFSTVPTEAMRNGDFRGITDSQGRAYNFYDPFTTNPTTYQRAPLSSTASSTRFARRARARWRSSSSASRSFRICRRESAGGPELGRPDSAPSPAGSQDRPHRSPVLRQRSGLWPLRVWQPLRGIPVSKPGEAQSHFRRGYALVAQFQRGDTWVHTFSTSLTNELLLTGTRDWQRRGSGDFQTNYTGTMGLPNPFNAPNWPNISGTDLTGTLSAATGSSS